MTAFVIFDEQILDSSRLEEYKSLAGPAITKLGGRFLERVGTITPLKAIGTRNAWWCWSSTASSRRGRGTTPLSIARPGGLAKVPC